MYIIDSSNFLAKSRHWLLFENWTDPFIYKISSTNNCFILFLLQEWTTRTFSSKNHLHISYVCSELEMEIMAFANFMVLFWGLGTVDEYCSINPSWTLFSSCKRVALCNQQLLTSHKEPRSTSRCQVSMSGFDEIKQRAQPQASQKSKERKKYLKNSNSNSNSNDNDNNIGLSTQWVQQEA